MSENRFVVCLSNEGYPASLEPRKLYEWLDDPQAESKAMLRIIDESGEDYLYPKKFFVPVALPFSARRAVMKTA